MIVCSYYCSVLLILCYGMSWGSVVRAEQATALRNQSAWGVIALEIKSHDPLDGPTASNAEIETVEDRVALPSDSPLALPAEEQIALPDELPLPPSSAIALSSHHALLLESLPVNRKDSRLKVSRTIASEVRPDYIRTAFSDDRLGDTLAFAYEALAKREKAGHVDMIDAEAEDYCETFLTTVSFKKTKAEESQERGYRHPNRELSSLQQRLACCGMLLHRRAIRNMIIETTEECLRLGGTPISLSESPRFDEAQLPAVVREMCDAEACVDCPFYPCPSDRPTVCPSARPTA